MSKRINPYLSKNSTKPARYANHQIHTRDRRNSCLETAPSSVSATAAFVGNLITKGLPRISRVNECCGEKPQLRAKTFTPKALRVGPGRLRRYPIGGKIRRTASQYILLLRTSNDFLRRKKWNHAENCIEPRRTFTVKSRRRVDDGHKGP